MECEAVVVVARVEGCNGHALVEELEQIHLRPSLDAKQIWHAGVEIGVKIPKGVEALLIETRVENAISLAGSPTPTIRCINAPECIREIAGLVGARDRRHRGKGSIPVDIVIAI